MYDYVIIGGGPCGLTLAWILGEAKKSVLVLEREQSLGGCHRVRRVNGLFTEHGPRIYLNNANTFKHLLSQMGLDFNQLFTPYNFNFTNIGGQTLQTMKPFEIFAFFLAYLNLIINPEYGRSSTLQRFMQAHQFTKSTQDYLDNLCRMTDGAGADRYTLFEFLQILNQHAFYQIVQPKLPNDLGLFKIWKKKLDSLSNVQVQLGQEVISIDSFQDSYVTGIQVKDTTNGVLRPIQAKNYLFAIPPQHLIDLFQRSKLNTIINSFGPFTDLTKWHQASQYNTYLPVIFHWSQKLDLPRVWGFSSTDWGLIYIVLTDYLTFNDSRSKTVISACITKVDNVSRSLGKTANQCGEGEIIDEVFEQLKLSYPNLPDPTEAIVSPGVHRTKDQWRTKDQSFILSTLGYRPQMQSSILKNLYWVGTHNGYHQYHFTSIESAVSNAVTLANQLIPGSKKKYQVKGSLSLLTVIYTTILIFIAIGIYFYFFKK